MKELMSNRPLLFSVAFLALYWAVAPFIERPGVSNAIAIFSICAGIFLFVNYIEATCRILFLKKRDPDGGHWAVYGATIAAFGTIYSGFATLLWNHFGQPEEWISTATLSFGRGLVPIGFILMGLSHQTMKVAGSYPKGFWRNVFLLFALVMAFIAGSQFKGS